MYFLALFSISILLCLWMAIRLLRFRKHDRVLYALCEVRRDLMSLLRENGFNLNKRDYFIARDMLASVNTFIHKYNEHKSSLFNFRDYMRFIRSFRRSQTREVKKRYGTLNRPDERICKIGESFQKAMSKGFLAYTPLIRSEMTLRFCVFILQFLTLAGLKPLQKQFENLKWVQSEIERHQHA